MGSPVIRGVLVVACILMMGGMFGLLALCPFLTVAR